MFNVKVTAKLMFMNGRPDNTFCTAEPFVRKPECHVKRMVSYTQWFPTFKVRVTFRTLVSLLGLLLPVYRIAGPFATKFMLGVHHQHYCLVEILDCMVFRIQCHGEGSKRPWLFVSPIFLSHWSLCNQTRCVDVLLPMTKPSANQLDIYWQQHCHLQYH